MKRMWVGLALLLVTALGCVEEEDIMRVDGINRGLLDTNPALEVRLGFQARQTLQSLAAVEATNWDQIQFRDTGVGPQNFFQWREDASLPPVDRTKTVLVFEHHHEGNELLYLFDLGPDGAPNTEPYAVVFRLNPNP